jgi:hypothetical protein
MWKFWIDMKIDKAVNILIIYKNLHKHKSFRYKILLLTLFCYDLVDLESVIEYTHMCI